MSREIREQRKRDAGLALIAALEEAGYEPSSYSGRGMYGERCVSISLEPRESAFGVALALVDALGATEIPGGKPQEDSLGLGVVLYWPEAAWPEDREDPDDIDPSERDPERESWR